MSTPAETEQPYTVVVGVSATSKSPTALAWAAAQARQNHGRVVAVRAWRTPPPQATPSGSQAARVSPSDDLERAARESLEADVADSLGADHGAELRLARGGRYSVLIKAAAGADLLVIDAPRALIAGPMFAHRLIYAATCPVVVMPPDISGEPDTVLTRMTQALGRSVLVAAGTAGRPGYRRPIVHDH
jgi:hypothetical protein